MSIGYVDVRHALLCDDGRASRTAFRLTQAYGIPRCRGVMARRRLLPASLALPPFARRRVPTYSRLAFASCVVLVACHNTAPPATSARPVGLATVEARPTLTAATRDASATADSRRSSLAAPPKSLNDEDVARTVVAVFGDSAAFRLMDVPSGDTPAAESGPVWDINVRSYETHERVTHYVQLFSTSAREHFRARLSRGTRYEPMIRAKLRAGGMPEDLTYLALIESGYDPNAYSRAAAVGLWQFMSTTARDVGLRVDWWVDERRDPARSTEGAIRFLGDLQKQFGSLYLAAAAYNGGPGRVARGLTRYAGEMEGSAGEDRFFALAEQDYLRPETKNYVPQLIAAALLAKMPTQYGITVDSLPAFAYDSVRAEGSTSLAAVATASGATAQQLLDLNPSILRGVVPPDGALWVHVPVGTAERSAFALDSMPLSQRLGLHASHIATSTTLAALAATAGVSEKQLSWYNPRLKTAKRGKLALGQSVLIPTRATVAFARGVPDPSIERYGSGNAVSSRGTHVVRRGESLGGIARKYGLSVARLKSLNGITSNRAVPGRALRIRAAIPVSRNASRSGASAKSTATRKEMTKSGGKVSSKSGGKSAKKGGAKSAARKSASKASKKAGKGSKNSGKRSAAKSTSKHKTGKTKKDAQ